MLECNDFYNALVGRHITFFTGVPDSLLQDFCAYISDYADRQNHIITANEGNAIALAAGYYLGTGRPALVYMQNSGVSNAINPLTSLVDPEVYGIPLLLLIGWRGEPGKRDEPQHIKQGRITLPLLQTLEVDYTVLPTEPELAIRSLERAIHIMERDACPYALVVREGTFHRYEPKIQDFLTYRMVREDALRLFADWTHPQDVVIATTGKTSRELFEYRVRTRGLHQDFLVVGSMGHASQLALGIALTRPKRQVFCLDGDGATIMHLGALATIGHLNLPNFKHVVINNGAHDSVGGQPTAGFAIDIPAIAEACGYSCVLRSATPEDFIEKLDMLRASLGPALLEIRVNKGARSDLGRPTVSPLQNKETFSRFLRGEL